MNLWAKAPFRLPRSAQPLTVTPQLCDSLAPANIHSIPHPHQLSSPSLLSSDLKIKYPCLGHNCLALKLSTPQASVKISGLPAYDQQEAGGAASGCNSICTAKSTRLGNAEPARGSSSGLLQDADRRGQNPSAVRASSLLLLPLLSLTLSSLQTRSLLQPSAGLAAPAEGALSHPSEGVADRAACSLAWGAPLVCTPRHNSLAARPHHLTHPTRLHGLGVT